ncbi:ATPase, T2SS/T4P/T4SS family, partial [uncultured Microbulbifer sp.]|uniref:ATPase, T2SS/T4P/T4SS family n=1 Tax=uncultured Microbulbifer sp. TaxID=348147 RepID=UPI0025D4D239
MSSTSLSGLPKRLVVDGSIDETTAHSALNAAKREGQSFAQHAVESKLIKSRDLANIASHAFGSPLFDLSSYNFDLLPKDIVDEKLISKHFALPLYKRGNRLFVAVADPTNLAGLDEINFNTGLNTDAVLVETDKLAKAIESYLANSDDIGGGLEGLDDEDLDSLEVESRNSNRNDDNEPGGDEAPVVRFVNKVLLDAIRTGASDIHFEPYEKIYRVRMRTDGILHEVARPPIQLASRLSARLKVMSKMDISERRVPQDGRIKMKLSKTKAIDFRVNSLPT